MGRLLKAAGRAPDLARDCPCVQQACPVHGNCVVCVRNHRLHKRHIPECLQPVLRELVAGLAGKLELGVVEQRPTPKPWKSRRGAKLPAKLNRDVGSRP
jgi:hypothetical protein